MTSLLHLLQRVAVALQSIIDRPDIPDELKQDLSELENDVLDQIGDLPTDDSGFGGTQDGTS